MKKPTILLTGDDGYKAMGTKILINALKDKYDLKVAATKTQKSGSGGGITFGKINWGKDEIDGIETVWVDAKPADSVEFAKTYYNQKFDIVISGVNFGPNVGTCSASGTFGAALRSFSSGVCEKSIAISYDLPPEYWIKDHQDYNLDDFIKYPQMVVRKLIDKIIANKFWGADLLNINLPFKQTNTAKFVHPSTNEVIDYYGFGFDIDYKNFTYIDKLTNLPKPEPKINTDTHALKAGNISIVPWLKNLYLNESLLKLVGKKIIL